MLTFASNLRSHFEARKSQDLLDSWRQKGWERLNVLGLPDKTHSAFQYVPLRELYTHSFERPQEREVSKEEILSAVYPECRASYVVFVDGSLRTDLSDLSGLPSSIILLPLADAFSTYGNILNFRLQKTLTDEKDPFAALNLALHPKGGFLFIPPQLELKTPIQCVHVSSSESATALLSHPRLHVFIGAHSRVKWICSSSGNSAHFFNHYTDVSIEEGASFHSVQVILPQENSWHFETLRATVKKDGQLNALSVTTGAKTVRQDFRVALVAPGASAKLQGIAMLNKSCHSHVHVLMDHQAPHTESSQLFKGILNHLSRSSFEGKIYVHPEAQKTQAYQLNNHLILEEGAMAYAKPNLEIFADDVKASHGATVAQIDPTQLFYLKTRGIDQQLAKQLLISGFCQELLTQIPHLSIAQEMQRMLTSFLRKHEASCE